MMSGDLRVKLIYIYMKNDPLIENMKNAEFMTAFQVLSQDVTTQAN